MCPSETSWKHFTGEIEGWEQLQNTMNRQRNFFSMTKKKKKAGETFVFQKTEGQSPFGAEGGEHDTADLTGLWKTKISLSIWEPQALSVARASGRNPAVVSRWCVTDFTEFEIKQVPSNVLKYNKCDLQDCFVRKEFVEKIGKNPKQQATLVGAVFIIYLF